jgi:hypothetical protein
LAKRHAKAFQGEKVYLVRSMEGGQDVEHREFDNAEHDLGRVNPTFWCAASARVKTWCNLPKKTESMRLSSEFAAGIRR